MSRTCSRTSAMHTCIRRVDERMWWIREPIHFMREPIHGMRQRMPWLRSRVTWMHERIEWMDIVDRDMRKSLAFYRLLGLSIDEIPIAEWAPHHASGVASNGVLSAIDESRRRPPPPAPREG